MPKKKIKHIALWAEWPIKITPSLESDDAIDQLAAYLSLEGMTLNTLSHHKKSNTKPDVILFLNTPQEPLERLLGEWKTSCELYTFLMESDVILPHNWQKESHRHYKKVFTWHTNLIKESDHYVWLNFPNNFKQSLKYHSNQQNKLCTLVAANKLAYDSKELYSERVRAIRWFEKHHPEEFDLYGIGWDKRRVKYSKGFNWLRLIPGMNRLCSQHYPSYRGKIDEKLPIMNRYRFSICYENAQRIPGYITEKIFDSLFARSIPVYRGAPDISDFIPKECYIDGNKFSNYDELYATLSNMPEPQYQEYIDAINGFLSSNDWQPYSNEAFCETIMRTITNN